MPHLKQEACSFKIYLNDMIIEVSEFYKQKGYVRAYVSTNKEPRRVCTLRKANGEMLSISYAKYIYTSFYNCDVNPGCQIDHINGDKMDDRIENLQMISERYNIKDRPRKEMVICVCPICNTEFLFAKKGLPFHPNPCCSRRCGGIKSHMHKIK